MDFYTTFTLRTWLKRDTPEPVRDILRYMCRNVGQSMPTVPDHPLFRTHRWDYMLRCSDCGPGLYYHHFHIPSADEDPAQMPQLSFYSSFKNYDGELQLFLDWITPWIYCGSGVTELYGYFHTENHDQYNLLFFCNGKFKQLQVCRDIVDEFKFQCNELRSIETNPT